MPEFSSLNSLILDVGSGKGLLLHELAEMGFTRLSGLDPYVDADTPISDVGWIRKKNVLEITEQFDVVMLHHSFEHMPNPLEILSHLRAMLRPNGYVLIRVPVLGEAWKRYQENWVQLDAPRHLILHTQASLKAMAESSGFKVFKVGYDSTAFQFWGSELYQMGKPLFSKSENTESVSGISHFSSEQLFKWNALARAWNLKQEGDQACFFLSLQSE